MVTGQEDVFYQMCMILLEIIQKVVESMENTVISNDTVVNELKELALEVESNVKGDMNSNRINEGKLEYMIQEDDYTMAIYM